MAMMSLTIQRSIQMFGTMDDFESLMATAKDNGIEIMLDMVFNHVSIEHEWFQKALAGDQKITKITLS